MHGMNNVSVTNAQQVRIIHHYKNTKEKLLKTNTAIWLNKVCRYKYLAPKCMDVSVSGNN
jgi:hypothetical protein